MVVLANFLQEKAMQAMYKSPVFNALAGALADSKIFCANKDSQQSGRRQFEDP